MKQRQCDETLKHRLVDVFFMPAATMSPAFGAGTWDSWRGTTLIIGEWLISRQRPPSSKPKQYFRK
jgi:hypothetical protein